MKLVFNLLQSTLLVDMKSNLHESFQYREILRPESVEKALLSFPLSLPWKIRLQPHHQEFITFFLLAEMTTNFTKIQSKHDDILLLIKCDIVNRAEMKLVQVRVDIIAGEV